MTNAFKHALDSIILRDVTEISKKHPSDSTRNYISHSIARYGGAAALILGFYLSNVKPQEIYRTEIDPQTKQEKVIYMPAEPKGLPLAMGGAAAIFASVISTYNRRKKQ